MSGRGSDSPSTSSVASDPPAAVALETLASEARCAFCYRPASSQLGQGELKDWQLTLSVDISSISRPSRTGNSVKRAHGLYDRPRTRSELWRMHLLGDNDGVEEIDLVGLCDDVQLGELFSIGDGGASE